MWDCHVAQLPYIPSDVLAGQDSQQQSGTVLIKNGTEVFPGCQETNKKNISSGFFFLIYSRWFLLSLPVSSSQPFQEWNVSNSSDKSWDAASVLHLQQTTGAPALSSGRL